MCYSAQIEADYDKFVREWATIDASCPSSLSTSMPGSIPTRAT